MSPYSYRVEAVISVRRYGANVEFGNWDTDTFIATSVMSVARSRILDLLKVPYTLTFLFHRKFNDP